MSGDYTLGLYSSVQSGAAPLGDLTKIARNWKRSKRLQGGDWLGRFVIENEPLSFLQDIYYNHLGGKILEEAGGAPSWSGLILEMDLDDTPRLERLEVTVGGYMQTAAWRFVSVGDGSMDDASAWIGEILATDCEFLNAGKISTNTLQVKKGVKMDMRALDELLKITELGDTSGAPWRIYADFERDVHYEKVNVTPEYYVNGGVKRRRSLLLMDNYVRGTYIDTDNNVQTLAANSITPSMSEYGQRQEILTINNVGASAAAARRDTYLAENAYPWPRAITAGNDAKVSDLNGDQVNPFTVEPGVFRDMHYPAGGGETDTLFLTDARDFIVDEVEVDAEGRVSLRSIEFEEAELMELQDRYRQEVERDA